MLRGKCQTYFCSGFRCLVGGSPSWRGGPHHPIGAPSTVTLKGDHPPMTKTPIGFQTFFDDLPEPPRDSEIDPWIMGWISLSMLWISYLLTFKGERENALEVIPAAMRQDVSFAAVASDERVLRFYEGRLAAWKAFQQHLAKSPLDSPPQTTQD